jgi:hypothetical protein
MEKKTLTATIGLSLIGLFLIAFICASLFVRSAMHEVEQPVSSELDKDKQHNQSEAHNSEKLGLSTGSQSAIGEPLENATKSNAEPVLCESWNEQQYAELQTQSTNYFKSLSSSDLPDDQLAHVFFSDLGDDASKISQLLALQRLQHPLIGLELIRLCTVNNANSSCSDALIEQITQIHKDDSQMWLQAVHFYAKKEFAEKGAQNAKIVNAIEQSTQGNYASAYFYEHVNLYTQSLENSEIGNYTINAVSAVGIYAAKILPYQPVTDWCKSAISTNNAKHTQACLTLGRQWEQYSPDSIDKMIGLAVQQLVYKAENNVELAQLIEDKKQAYGDYDGRDADIIFQNERLLRAYINGYQVLGEHGSLMSLEDEVNDFKQTQQYKQCQDSFWQTSDPQ